MAMKHVNPEFSRPFEVAKLPNSGAHEKISADQKERAALAKRLGVPALHALEAKLLVKSWRGGGFKVSGELQADIDQVSVVSLEAFRQVLAFPVERYFVTTGNQGDDIDDDLVDVWSGGAIDLVEIVAETLALELDPYPRKPGESFDLAT
jgi:uncharacterized metal-binding protein YceD (DUF177 family)